MEYNAKRDADLVLFNTGQRFYLYMNRPLNIKPSRSIEVREGVICATKKAYEKLKQQYRITCDFE